MAAALPLIFAGVGAASAVAGVASANAARKDAKKQAARQEQTARNAGALDKTAANADANFVLGTADPTKMRKTPIPKTGAGAKTTSTQTAGGVSASSVGGL